MEGGGANLASINLTSPIHYYDLIFLFLPFYPSSFIIRSGIHRLPFLEKAFFT